MRLMPKNADESLSEAEGQVDDRSHALMLEFHAHKDEVLDLHPEHAGRDQMMFESWAIQKIAGLQLSVEHLADLLNRHLTAHKQD